MINSFDDFVKANGETKKHDVEMRTNKGGLMKFQVAMLGAESRDKLQAHSMSQLANKDIEKVKREVVVAKKAGKDVDAEKVSNGFDLSKYRGNSALMVSLGAINENDERFMDSPEALKYLDSEVNTTDLNKIAKLVDELSGTTQEAIEEAEKK